MARASRRSPAATIRVLDLFAGAGGLTAGFREASNRFQTIRAVEYDVAAAASYSENHGKAVVFAGSMQSWLRTDDVPMADLIIGGPPCQGFSALGKQQELDIRNQLWLRYADTIRRTQPKYFVLENVASFLQSPQFQRFKRQARPSGRLGAYTFRAQVLNAADYGAAQLRKRAVLIGHHRDLAFPGFPETTHSRESWSTLRDALSGLSECVRDIALPDARTGDANELPGPFRTDQLHLTRQYEPRSLERFGYIGEGESRFTIPHHLLPPCWRNHKTGSVDVMGRLAWDKPSVTIRTEFFKPEKGRYLHPREHRALTHHEAARIQGFSDHYKWVGSKISIARQIGNAVPIPLGAAIARQLLASDL